MKLERDAIVQNLKAMLSDDQVVTDHEVLLLSSVDRFRKYEELHRVFTQPIPAAVVYAKCKEEVSKILAFANEHGINIVPRTGHSATEGGLETPLPNSVVLDGSMMNEGITIDIENMMATAQCGVPLQVLEDKLREQGYTTGHSPQSKPLAQMGGLVATRSIGQFSTLYGGIEDMVVGVEAVFPDGHIAKIKNVPRRAAGPDIRHIVIGNEGALCFITEVTVKIFKFYPDNYRFHGYTLDNMKTGFEILREVMVQGYRPSVARLYDVEDGGYHFSHFADGKCVLIFAAEGPEKIAKATSEAISEIVAKYPECVEVDPKYIETWFADLNWDPVKIQEERDEIMATNNIGHTTEVSANWSEIYNLYEVCVRRIKEEIPNITMMGGHSSHSYINGTNMYFVYYYNVLDCKPEEEITKYHYAIMDIIIDETIKRGGSICHHHGVGKNRAQYMDREHGDGALYIMRKLKEAFDPNHVMNMGTILPLEK